MKRLAARAVVAALLAAPLAACVDSVAPILPDAQPILGQHLRLQLYSLHGGHADDPGRAAYKWTGKSYTHAAGDLKDVAAFSVHPFEGGNYIVQTVPQKKTDTVEYALMRKLADGVFLTVPIDEMDADEATRGAGCKKVDGASCRIETRDQLFAFARATAERHKDDGGLVIRLPDAAKRPHRKGAAPRHPR